MRCLPSGIISLLACTALFSTAGEIGRPIIRTFGTSEAHAKGPVLSFAEAADGSLFIGSNQLVTFDGVRWQLIEAPGIYGFRALGGTGNRIWVGAETAVGFVERDQRGIWNFTSLVLQLRAALNHEPPPIDLVVPVGNGAVFVSSREILRWNGRVFESWLFPGQVVAATLHNSVLFHENGGGLFILGETGPPQLVRPASQLPDSVVDWLLPANETAGLEGLLLETPAGLYRIGEGKNERLTSLSAAVQGKSPHTAVRTDHDDVAIATDHDGVVLASARGEIESTINRAAGMTSDRVHCLWYDRRRALWMGLDNGCARLDRNTITSEFDAREGLEKGLPRRVVDSGGHTFVVTDQSVYLLDTKEIPCRFIPIAFVHSQLLDAVAIGDDVWVSATDGLWNIQKGATLVKVADTKSPVTMTEVPWLPGLVYSGDHRLIGLRHSPSGKWESGVLLERLAGEPNSLLSGKNNEIWVSTTGEIDRYHFKASNDNKVGWHNDSQESLFAGPGLPVGGSAARLGRAGPRIFAFTSGGVLEWARGEGFAPVPEISGWTVLSSAHFNTNAEQNSPVYWLAKRAGLPDSAPIDVLRVYASGEARGPIRWEPLRTTGLDALGEITSFDLLDQNGEKTEWVGGKGGVIRLNWAEVLPVGPMRDLAIREVRLDDSILLPIRPDKPVSLKPGLRSIEFGFSAAQPMEPEPTVYYQTRLVGEEEQDWSLPQRKTSREFTGLVPGSYVFMVRRYDRYGRIGSPISYPFAVLPPWYQEWPARAAASAALVALAWGIYRWRIRSLRAQTERLNRLVAKRTRELELSNTAKSEFLENISHEIRNPLNGIVGLSRLLHGAQLEPKERELAQSLQASAEHLRRVSEDVLDLSKAEFGNLVLANDPFSLRSVLREIAGHYMDSARQAGEKITLVVNESINDHFLGDEKKIRTIVSNFVANAVKYAPGGPIEIRADWTDESDTGARFVTQVFIAVTDAGPGVPSEEQEVIFQKFVRGTEAKRSSTPGSGIGLATCRTLAKQMGGSISIESPPNMPLVANGRTGAAFLLWVPLERSSESGITGFPSREPASSSSLESQGDSGAALIVDDEAYNRLVVAGLARELDYSTVVADQAAVAIEAARNTLFDLVFLDLELSVQKGVDVARALRSARDGNLALIIAITGSDSEAARERCIAAGMDGFLLKPFSRSQVEAVITGARRRTFELYARGSGKTVAEASREYIRSLKQESSELSAGLSDFNREALQSCGHRLRTLAALGRFPSLYSQAGRLDKSAQVASEVELTTLAQSIIRAIGACEKNWVFSEGE